MKAGPDARLWVACLALLCVLCLGCGVSKNSRYWETVRAYKVAPLIARENDTQVVRWSTEVTLSGGVRASVEACSCGPTESSRILVQFSDEQEARVVYDYVDYVYPADVRIEGTVMYAQVSGVAGGVLPQTRLIVYDLAARKKVREIKADPADLK